MTKIGKCNSSIEMWRGLWHGTAFHGLSIFLSAEERNKTFTSICTNTVYDSTQFFILYWIFSTVYSLFSNNFSNTWFLTGDMIIKYIYAWPVGNTRRALAAFIPCCPTETLHIHVLWAWLQDLHLEVTILCLVLHGFKSPGSGWCHI